VSLLSTSCHVTSTSQSTAAARVLGETPPQALTGLLLRASAAGAPAGGPAWQATSALRREPLASAPVRWLHVAQQSTCARGGR
jgi:hypothetical protein